MKNRYIPYGYRLEQGQLAVEREEAKVVREIYGRYAQGQSFQDIADTLIKLNVPYSEGTPCWNKNNVKRIIENRKYIGEGGCPPILESEIFQTVRGIHEGKTAHWWKAGNDPTNILWDRLRCGACGGRMLRNGSPAASKGIVQLRCENKGCGNALDVPLAELHTAIFAQLGGLLRQKAERDSAREYQPSTEVIRLNNAINRAIENPDDPAEARKLILRGAAVRYDCCPDADESVGIPAEPDWELLSRWVGSVEVGKDHNIHIRPSF